MNTKFKKNRRWRFFCDARIQSQLCVRITIYWLICQSAVFGTIAILSFISNSAEPISRFAIPAFVASSLFLPLLLVDMLIFSNRFAGPMVQFRRQLNRLANEKSADEIRLRSGDYYSEVATDINELSQFVQSERARAVESQSTISNRNTSDSSLREGSHV